MPVVARPKAKLVRTLLQAAARPAGGLSLGWDRRNAAGQRVKSGKYSLTVEAVESGGARVCEERRERGGAWSSFRATPALRSCWLLLASAGASL